MNDLDFFKSIYDRELNRRISLDNAVSLPIGIITVLVGLISYYYTDENFKSIIVESWIAMILLILAIISISISILFIIKSYNNFLIGFKYPNFALLKSIRDFQKKQLPEYNSQVSKDKHIIFEESLIERLISITDKNTEINDNRAKSLYISRTWIVISFTILFITTIYLLIKNI